MYFDFFFYFWCIWNLLFLKYLDFFWFCFTWIFLLSFRCTWSCFFFNVPGDFTVWLPTLAAMLNESLPPSTAIPRSFMMSHMAEHASSKALPSPGSLAGHIQLPLHLMSCKIYHQLEIMTIQHELVHPQVTHLHCKWQNFILLCILSIVNYRQTNDYVLC